MTIVADLPIKETVTAGSMLNHLKENRIEYMLAVGVLHLLGVSDKIISLSSGVCA